MSAPAKPYFDMATQKAIGAKGERALDAHFATWFDIRYASDFEQSIEIDRIFIPKTGGEPIKVEYKTDLVAHQTNRAFVELSNGEKPGWLQVSQSDWLVYYIPGAPYRSAYILRVAQMRLQLPRWSKYKRKQVQNKRMLTEGVLVSLREFERIAINLIDIEEVL